MKISIDEDICKKYRLDLPLVCSIVLLTYKKTYEECVKELLNRGIIEEKESLFGKQYEISLSWYEKVQNILIDSEATNKYTIDDRVKNLTTVLREIYPKGIKPGTQSYWRGNIKNVEYKLKKFFVKYGNFYTDEQIINATRSYVNRHASDTTCMRVLPYFIEKDNNSDLATILENLDDEGNIETPTNNNYDSTELVV